jgi:pimeloyl-ACP methyl ester carboxylesterase
VRRFSAAALVAAALAGLPAWAAPPTSAGAVLHRAAVFDIKLVDRARTIEQGLLRVPEDRARRGARPRNTAVEFWRIRAASRNPGTPVLLLPGGPGEWFEPQDVSEDRAFQRWVDVLAAGGREVIVLNQRGHPNTFGAWRMTLGDCNPASGLPLDDAAFAAAWRVCLQHGVERAQARGIALTGFDIVNLVEDIEALRRALGHPRLALAGVSFGSQLALAYMNAHPQRVERALLGGVEPLTLAHDSPAHVWTAYRRLLDQASAAPALAARRPPDGFAAALVDTLARLAREPVDVEVLSPDCRPASVRMTAFALRRVLKRPFEHLDESGNLALLPQLVDEAHRGDLRLPAALWLQEARDAWEYPLMPWLVDSSIGIDARRDRAFVQEAATAPLGDINLSLRTAQRLLPVRPMPAAWRKPSRFRGPVWLLQGDFDTSTPLENIDDASLPSAATQRTVIRNGGHFALEDSLQHAPDLAPQLKAFLAGRHDGRGAARLPREVTLPAPDFTAGADRPTLYAQWLARHCPQPSTTR